MATTTDSAKVKLSALAIASIARSTAFFPATSASVTASAMIPPVFLLFAGTKRARHRPRPFAQLPARSELADRCQEFRLTFVNLLRQRALLGPLLPDLARDLAKLRLLLLAPVDQRRGVALGHRLAVLELLVHPGAQAPFVHRGRHDRLLFGT